MDKQSSLFFLNGRKKFYNINYKFEKDPEVKSLLEDFHNFPQIWTKKNLKKTREFCNRTKRNETLHDLLCYGIGYVLVKPCKLL